MSTKVCFLSLQTQKVKSCLPLRIARTEEEKRKGMMFEPKMDYALAFLYSDVKPRSLWMKNVKFHLDMVFCKKNLIVQIQAGVPPCTALKDSECPIVDSLPSDLVIELPGGWASKLNLQIGDVIVLT